MSQNKYAINLVVNENHLDALNHVNNVQYVQWIQDIAGEHWAKLSTSEMNNKYVWVVLRHEVDYQMAAMLSDKLKIDTWIGNTIGVRSERFVEITKNNNVVAKAKTIWCLLDKDTMKPTKIPFEILNLLEINKG